MLGHLPNKKLGKPLQRFTEIHTCREIFLYKCEESNLAAPVSKYNFQIKFKA